MNSSFPIRAWTIRLCLIRWILGVAIPTLAWPLSAGAGSWAPDAFPERPAVVAGPWRMTLCGSNHSGAAPGSLVRFQVGQAGWRIQGTASGPGGAAGMLGWVDGHHVQFTFATTEPVACQGNARLFVFSGTVTGAYIRGVTHPLGMGFEDEKTETPAVVHIRREFMLSFDDGPVPGGTEKVLDALAQLRNDKGKPVKAAFFMIGDAPRHFWAERRYFAPYELWTGKGSVAEYPALVRQVADAGHFIGNHTDHHAWFRWPWLDTPDAIEAEFAGWQTAMAGAGVHPAVKLYRPPYLVNPPAVEAEARKLGYRTILGVTAGDAVPFSTESFVASRSLDILENWAGPGPCLLIFHDIRPVTQDHLRDIVEGLQAQGFVLVDFDPSRAPGF